MIFKYAIVEFCVHCDTENEYEDYDPQVHGYVVRCGECGAQICLCDACMHAPDNKGQYCDWHIARENKHWEQGKCFRGTTFNKKYEVR